MNKYVVALISFFDNEIKQFKIEAESEYEAVKKSMIEMCTSDEGRESELEFQKTNEFPKNINEYSEYATNCDMDFSVTEVKEF
jgi:hypothetical protein